MKKLALFHLILFSLIGETLLSQEDIYRVPQLETDQYIYGYDPVYGSAYIRPAVILPTQVYGQPVQVNIIIPSEDYPTWIITAPSVTTYPDHIQERLNSVLYPKKFNENFLERIYD
jgi:hypothetical protein